MIRNIRTWVKTHLPEDLIDQTAWIKRYVLSLQYAGLRFKCPVCAGRFRIFLPYGLAHRRNACCPRCGSLERHRLYRLYLKDKTDLFESRVKFLHIAPESCLSRMFKKYPGIDYISADLNDASAMMSMDITDIKFEDDTFDCILCVHVLEHIIDDKKAMKELFRVLKPYGWAIIQVPIKLDKTYEDLTVDTPEQRLECFGQADHVRVYGKDYKERLESVGFSVRIDSYLDELDDNIINRCKLTAENEPKEKIYYCTKVTSHFS